MPQVWVVQKSLAVRAGSQAGPNPHAARPRSAVHPSCQGFSVLRFPLQTEWIQRSWWYLPPPRRSLMASRTRSAGRGSVRGSALMLVVMLGAGLLLGGCSSSDAAPPAQLERPAAPTTGGTGDAASGTGSPPSATSALSPARGATPSSGAGTTMPPAGGGQEAPPVAGLLSGEIASVRGTSMQLRSGGVSTTVTWAASTTFQTVQAGRTNGIKTGQCVVATRGAKVPGSGDVGDQVTAVVVSDPVGGVCADSRDTSSDSRVVSGLVTSVKGTAVTVRTKGIGRPTATVNLVLAKNVGMAKAGDGSARDVVRGRCANVSGARQGAGTFVATSITISKPGSSGCPA